MNERIIIDTDPGQDDAVGILLALASPEIEVLGITCVGGNVPLSWTTRNARVVCELAGRRDVPVFGGCAGPMQGELVTAEYIHGKTGLDGADLPEPTMPLDPRHGVDFIIETLRAEPAGTVTLVPMGPLTNIATAFTKAPDIVERVKRIVLMGGGCFEGGNITPAAEFNIYVDPEAADIVFRCGRPITVVPLDTSHKALTSPERVAAIRNLGTPVGEAVAGWLEFFERFDVEKYGSVGGPLHDPCTVAWLIKPELFTGREINVMIELDGTFTRGMTVADWWGVTGREPNALFLGHVDAEGFYALLTERLANL